MNSAARRKFGPDTGYDTVGDFPQIAPLSAYLDLLARENALPRMILYNNNPADTFSFATLIGCFQNGEGELRENSVWQRLVVPRPERGNHCADSNALSNVGLLSRFIGMVTDSRSFMSYPRHEYFRRVLCDILGREVARGELPNDERILRQFVEAICYRNAQQYLQLPTSK